MANASKNNMGAGAQGKGSGVGGMTDLDEEMLEENQVLSNRDKAQHAGGRGLDSKAVQNEQFHDHAGNHMRDEPAASPADNPSRGQARGASAPMSNASSEDSSLKK